MSSTQKVAIVTGASQGIGEALVTAYGKLGYAVAATSRSIRVSDDPQVLTLRGDLSRPGTGAQVVEQTDRLHPVGRMGEIGEVVEAIVYLEQARFVTGEILHVDGGQSAGH